jgi:hypothetical protein
LIGHLHRVQDLIKDLTKERNISNGVYRGLIGQLQSSNIVPCDEFIERNFDYKRFALGFVVKLPIFDSLKEGLVAIYTVDIIDCAGFEKRLVILRFPLRREDFVRLNEFLE